MDLKGFYNYAVNILIAQNAENGEPELNIAGEKSQDKNELILCNTIINRIRYQISEMIWGFVPLSQDS